MPRQIFSSEEFIKLLEKATECRVVRRENKVKLKLRTPKLLYTYVTTPEEAENLLKNVKIEIKEF
ncbi:MAG: hypothetical protein N3F06_02675 [Nitrososphaerales archaeon]|nr:hypothetical protein [Nitrososphaerales archaeon]